MCMPTMYLMQTIFLYELPSGNSVYINDNFFDQIIIINDRYIVYQHIILVQLYCIVF